MIVPSNPGRPRKQMEQLPRAQASPAAVAVGYLDLGDPPVLELRPEGEEDGADKSDGNAEGLGRA